MRWNRYMSEIDVTDKSPFFIWPYHVKEDKAILDKEMKKLCYLGFIKDIQHNQVKPC